MYLFPLDGWANMHHLWIERQKGKPADGAPDASGPFSVNIVE